MNLEIEKPVSKQNCSLAERQEKHAQRIALRAGIPLGEPLPELSESQMLEYSNVLHQNSGLSHEDARRVFRDVRERYANADEVEKTRIAQTISFAVEGLKQTFSKLPKRQEVTVYKEN